MSTPAHSPRPRTCTQLIIASGIGRVVIAWREPSLFVADCQGYELLERAKDRDISGRSSMSKEELVDALRD